MIANSILKAKPIHLTSTTIQFSTPLNNTTIRIYNITGQVVQLIEKPLRACYTTYPKQLIKWNLLS